MALAGCDRAQLDPVGTELLVAMPDLGVVQLEPDLALRLVPPEFSGALTVRVGGRAVAFDSTEGAFVVDVQLERGLNLLPVEVTDDTDQTERDTLYAVYFPIRPLSLPGFAGAAARADAAAAPLATGQAVITGGSDAAGQALATTTVVQASGGQLSQSAGALSTARTGHTATATADGVLLLGGTSTDTPASSADFVSQGEWVRTGGESRVIEVEGGLQRTRHTARALTLDGVTYLYLYGGVVPAGSGLARSGTVDIYEFQPGGVEARLVRLSPPGGSGGFTVLSDHLQLATGATSATVLGLAGADPVSFAFDWSLPGTAAFPFSLRASPASGAVQARTRAAAVDLGGGLSFVSGGRGEGGETLGSLEIYSAQAGRSFLVPLSVRLQRPRYDHSATIFPGNRIVIGGGRTDGGAPLSSYESFQL